jgi:hypothetical protein
MTVCPDNIHQPEKEPLIIKGVIHCPACLRELYYDNWTGEYEFRCINCSQHINWDKIVVKQRGCKGY